MILYLEHQGKLKMVKQQNIKVFHYLLVFENF